MGRHYTPFRGLGREFFGKPLNNDGISLVSTINEGALLALSISVLWALTSLLAASPAPRWAVSASTGCGCRWWPGLIAFAAWIAVQNGGLRIDVFGFGVLSLSGLIGIFLGDTLLYSTLARVGPRRPLCSPPTRP